MRYHLFKTVCLLFLVSFSFAEGELVVFVANSGSEVDKAFQSNTLPKIKQFAEGNSISFKVRSAKDGLPPEITTLPAIVFQNYLGRSVYVGRNNQLEKVINFVRTARRIPQTKAGNTAQKQKVEKTWIKKDGKSITEVKPKITELSGVSPKKFNTNSFKKEAETIILTSMPSFSAKTDVAVSVSDRRFYANFYPYLAEDGTLYITTELYSQFHCHEPIYTTLGKPFSSKWKEREEGWSAAAKDIEKQVVFHSRNPENGDGFNPVSSETPIKSWEALNLPLPPAPEGAKAIPADLVMPTNWKVRGPVSDLDPMVAFSFPPPVDNYSGEVKKLDGLMSVGSDLILNTVKGDFAVNMHSLTMGDPDLDESVKAEDMLNANTYPGASFSFEGFNALEDKPLEFGVMQTANTTGKFTFMGITVDKTINAQITPLVDDEGNPVLEVSVSFAINILNPFGITGPDGPSPQKNTVKFMLNFLMEAQ